MELRDPAIGHCGSRKLAAVLAMVLMGLLGCGAKNTPAEVKVPTLDGARSPMPVVDVTPAVDLTGAPTDAHRALGKLLPPTALIAESLKFAGWDAGAAVLMMDDPASASLPVVYADYLSTGYEVMGDGEKRTVKQKYPQNCNLYVIKAPEPAASEPIARAIREKLRGKGFTEREPLELVMGVRAPGTSQDAEAVRVSKVADDDKLSLKMDRFTHIVPDAGGDKVYVAYVCVIDDIVVYALELENPPALTSPDGTRITGITDDQRGSRLGAQLIVLLHHRM
jgi:type IV pilus biogenesis protein CpaD/CtpE